MKVLSSFVAVGSLFAVVALLPLIGGVIFAVFLFGLFLLGLAGVLSGAEDRSVRQHNPKMDPTGWRRRR